MFEHIFENSLNELYIFHPHTLKFVAVNRVARGNLGYTIEELKTLTPLDLKPQLDLPNFRKLLDPLISGKQQEVIFETMHRRKDGSLYPVEVHIQLFEYEKESLCLVLVVDLTKRRAMEEEIDEKQATLNAIVGAARDAIVMIDEQGCVTFWNPAAEQIFGYSREKILGKDLHRILVPDEHLYQLHIQAFERFRLTGQGNAIGKTLELKAKRKDGREIDVELSLSALKFKNAWNAVGIVRDISERKRLEEEKKRKEEQLRRLSVTDPLTNTYNRRYFVQKVEEEIERAKRLGSKFSIVMLDIDHFKKINDKFGHNAGDLVLKSMTQIIKNRIRKIDTLARWGVEEFVILLPDTPVKNAVTLAEDLRKKLSQMDIPGVGRVTASFGVAGYCPGDNVDSLVNKADNMMYEAKVACRNCMRVAEECE